MKLVIDGKNINVKDTKINLRTDSTEAHQQMQFIEKYFRAMFKDDLDVTKIHFYSGNPARNKNEIEITPDQAMAELHTGYPILVKHEDVKDVMPFVKRRGTDDKYTLYSGREILGVEKYPKPDLGFDFESFRKEPVPPKPGFWENLFISIGFKKSNERYENYQEYLRKSQILKDNEAVISKYDCEKAAYKLAENVCEGDNIEEYIRDMDKAPEVNEQLEANINYEMVEPDVNETININQEMGPEPEGKKVYPKARAKDNPLLPPDKKKEILDRKAKTVERKELKKSKFMARVKDEIRDKNLNDEEVYREVLDSLNEARKEFNHTGSFSTRAYIEHARVVLSVDKKLETVNRRADMINFENNNFALISNKEYDSLDGDKKRYFVKWDKDSYIEREYLINKKHLEEKERKLKLAVKDVIKNGDVVVDKIKEKETLKEYTREDKEEVKIILKDINAKRESVRNTIAKAITKELIASNKELDERKTLQTVRYGYTFKKITAKAYNLEKCAGYVQNNPEKLVKVYTKELETLEKAIYNGFNGEAKKAEKAEKVEAVKVEDKKPEEKNAIKEEAPKISL